MNPKEPPRTPAPRPEPPPLPGPPGGEGRAGAGKVGLCTVVTDAGFQGANKRRPGARASASLCLSRAALPDQPQARPAGGAGRADGVWPPPAPVAAASALPCARPARPPAAPAPEGVGPAAGCDARPRRAGAAEKAQRRRVGRGRRGGGRATPRPETPARRRTRSTRGRPGGGRGWRAPGT